MKFCLVRPVKAPIIAHPGDAGIDFFVPTFTDKFLEDFLIRNGNKSGFFSRDVNNELVFYLPPHHRVLIPSGVHVNLEGDKPIALIANNKSGIASRYGLDIMAEVVDQHYQGEVHISLNNTSTQVVEIKQGQKIVQFVRYYINSGPIEQLNTLEELYPNKSSRSDGGFGSTDKRLNYDPNI